jgi:hypothetical protein
VLLGIFRFQPLEAVILNKAMSLVVVAAGHALMANSRPTRLPSSTVCRPRSEDLSCPMGARRDAARRSRESKSESGPAHRALRKLVELELLREEQRDGRKRVWVHDARLAFYLRA